MILFLLLACRTATVVDACDADPAHCFTCASSDECGFTGNACTETVFCAHEDASIAVIQIGCDRALEYAWPDDAACACVDGGCAYVE
ncbi:MAG: hypothetical protein ACK4YP_12245 [Myxococcota bacterium]